MKTLHCTVPYALEGWLRREIDAAGAALLEVKHGSLVDADIALPESDAPAFVQRINDAGQGRVGWRT
jgi:putative IMPACT (imprinted ancient) family translation regulator